MFRSMMKILLVFLVASQAVATPIKEEPAAAEAAPVANAGDNVPAEAPAVAQHTVVKDAPAEDAVEPAKTPTVAQEASDDQREARTLNNVDTMGEREQALLSKLNSKCTQREVSSCVMLKMVSYINKLLKKANIQVTEGLEISQTEAVVEEEIPVETEGARALDADESEESQVSELIAGKLWAFVRSRSLRWNIFPDADVVLSASPDKEGALNLGMSMRAGKAVEMARKKNNMGPLLAAGVMKLGLIGGVAFKALALLVGKALILSKIAFLLGAILWLKKLFSSQQRHVTYEVVGHPHSHSHSHSAEGHGHSHDTYAGSSGWGRQLGAPAGSAPAGQELAYRAHAPVAAAPAHAPAAAAPVAPAFPAAKP